MAGFNPCCCWNLKDGCVTIGIWTLAFSLFTLAVFSWQTAVINDCRYTLTTRNTFYCPDYCPCRTYVRYHGGEHVLVDVLPDSVGSIRLANVRVERVSGGIIPRLPLLSRLLPVRKESPGRYHTGRRAGCSPSFKWPYSAGKRPSSNSSGTRRPIGACLPIGDTVYTTIEWAGATGLNSTSHPKKSSTPMFSLCQLALFGWQTDIIKWLKDKAANDRAGPNFGVWKPEHERWPGYYEEYWMTRKEKIYWGLFVVQILNLIAAFFLLFASVALIYGIHTSSKYLVWPWFPCIVAGIICSLAYCVMWWVGDVSGYWLVLTVVEVVSVLINIYCLLCVIVQYRRIVRGYQAPSEDDSVKEQRLVGYDYPYRPTDTGMFTYGPEKKVGEGVWNVMYEPDTRVHMYGKDTQGRPIVAPSELVAYSTEPAGAAEQPTQPEREQEFPCSKSEMTEEWLKNVMSSHPEEPKEQPASPVKEKTYSRSRSVDALQKETRGRSRRSMRSAKSKESMSRRAADSSVCSTCTVSSVEGRSRSEGRHRAKAASDSEDTGYSRSAIDSYADQQKKKKHRHHRHRHGHEHGDREHRSRRHRKRGEDGDEENKGKKRLRDVKREDKERRVQQQQEDQASIPVVRPETSSSATGPPAGAVPVFPFGAGRGAISIPQHIVIPPQPKGAPNQPQRFHINSEITISYSDRSAPGSDSEHRPPSSGAPIGPQQATQAGLTTPPVPPPRNTADSNKSNTSAESKGYGSTAV